MTFTFPQDNLAVALSYHDHGLNIIPIKADGSKQPRTKWNQYQTGAFPRNWLAQWFGSPGNPSGIGIVCGGTSGNLEVLDFDVHRVWPLWSDRVAALLSTLPIVKTPDNGRHVYYRCPAVEGNLVLARSKSGDILIETRGQGGYVIAPGSPASTHPTGRPYRMEQGDLRSIPTITPEQRTIMLDAARAFNAYTPPTILTKRKAPVRLSEPACDAGLMRELFGEWPLPVPIEVRPGDDFNERAEWSDILEPHGWTLVKTRGDVSYWRKPGSSGNEHHATSNYGNKNLLVIYSTSIEGFESTVGGEPPVPYSKFAAYAILYHKGDFTKAAQQLADKGYGSNNRGSE